MASLQLSKVAQSMAVKNWPAQLYRKVMKEMPHIMMLYDIMDLGEDHVKAGVRSHFYRHADIKDDRVIHMLLETGYYHLEDTMLQYKQKNHLLNLLEGLDQSDLNNKKLSTGSSIQEAFVRD